MERYVFFDASRIPPGLRVIGVPMLRALVWVELTAAEYEAAVAEPEVARQLATRVREVLTARLPTERVSSAGRTSPGRGRWCSYGSVRTESVGRHNKCLPPCCTPLGHLRCHHPGGQSLKSLQEKPPFFGQRHSLPYSIPRAEEMSHFVKRPTEPGGRLKAPKPPHGIVALFYTAVIVLDPVRKITVTAVREVGP
jgi:hypothetical protein